MRFIWRYKMTILRDISGKKFCKLTAIKPLFKKNRHWYWLFKCDCGKTIKALSNNVTRGHTKSCGCQKIKHGFYKNRLYTTWLSMKERCYNEKDMHFKNYGGRGIKICDEWRFCFDGFKEWAFKNGYKKTLTIDRIDVNGNYCPENCRWSTKKEQSRNRRNNKIIEYNGERHCHTEWEEILGFNRSTIYNRLKANWSIEKIINTPTKKERK